jgi:hypothetical protein
VLSCVTHVRRKIEEHLAMTGTDYMNDHVMPKVNMIILAKSPPMFEYLYSTACMIWSNDGKLEFVAWIKKVCLNPKWEIFYHKSTMPGYVARNPRRSLWSQPNGRRIFMSKFNLFCFYVFFDSDQLLQYIEILRYDV